MSAFVLVALLIASFVTAFISGVFGMAGGLILMGVLALLLPVSAAFVTHGALQIVANGWRGLLLRKHISWAVVGYYAGGAALAGAVLAALAYRPNQAWVMLALGLAPLLAWLPAKTFALDAQRPLHAVGCGLGVTGLNLAAGVAGPLLDVFFIRTAMSRHQIVATKAATQVLSHFVKVVFYGAPLAMAGQQGGAPPLWVFALAIPLSMLGTALGGKVLDRMSDRRFLAWTKWLVTAVGAFYLWCAFELFGAGA